MKLLVKLVGFVHWEPWSRLSGRVPTVRGPEDIVALPNAKKEGEPSCFPVCPWDTAVVSGDFLVKNKAFFIRAVMKKQSRLFQREGFAVAAGR